MFKLEVEHHPHFTAVYVTGHLAAMIHRGTLEQRQAIPDEKWYELATVASTLD